MPAIDLQAFALEPALLLPVFVTVLVIMDPVGNVPIFLALTRGRAPAELRLAAWQATAVAGGVILGFGLLGEQLLRVLGISLEALQVAGGLLLILVALELLNPRPDTEKDPLNGRNVALVPIGTPLLAGPGAIAATMLYMSQADTVGGVLSVLLALLGVLVIVWLGMRFAPLLARLLGENGIELVSRLLGFLLAAIAVQFIATAIADWVRYGVV